MAFAGRYGTISARHPGQSSAADTLIAAAAGSVHAPALAALASRPEPEPEPVSGCARGTGSALSAAGRTLVLTREPQQPLLNAASAPAGPPATAAAAKRSATGHASQATTPRHRTPAPQK